MPEDEPDDTRW